MSAPPIRIVVAGALGRMGLAVTEQLRGREDLALVGRFDRTDVVGEGLTTVDLALGMADVAIDFTTPAASVELARQAAERGAPRLVIGATGWTPEQDAAIAQASERVAIVKAGNYSLGLNVLVGLVHQAAATLAADDYDIEVLEAHHRRKVDAPSGTALMLGAAAAEGRGAGHDALDRASRDGVTGPREAGRIGFAVLRGGGIVGEHSVLFAAEDEILTLSHSARDRSLFARGALEAARWVAARSPGLYDMQNVLGFTSPA